jgi:hypothetical protein
MRNTINRPTEFRGHLYIFVDKPGSPTTESNVPTESVFDDAFGGCEPGSMRWHMTGWAVGKNVQGRYCARTSLTKAKRFNTFAEASDYARKKRWTRPQDVFYLVYELDACKHVVTSLAQILRLDAGPEAIQSGSVTDPVLERIADKVGKIVATNALALHRMLQHEGAEAARARFSRATYDRLWGVLLEAGVVTEEVQVEACTLMLSASHSENAVRES